MAQFVAPSAQETQFSGQYGNSSVAFGTYNPAAPAVNDTVVLLKLYAGTKISNIELLTGANGAGTTLDLGFLNVDGSAGGNTTQFFAAQAASAASRTRSLARPLYLVKDVYIVATFKGAVGGAASATNFIDVIVDFEFRGV